MTRPLRDSSAHGEVGSPEKDKLEKRTPVAEPAAGCLFHPCRGEGSPDSTPELRAARRQVWRLAQKSRGLKCGGFLLYCLAEPLGFLKLLAVTIRIRNISSYSSQPLRSPGRPGPVALE